MSEHRLEVSPAQAGATLAALVRELLVCPWTRARELVRTGRVELDGRTPTDPALRVEAGALVVVRPEAPKRTRGVLPEERVVHLDDDVIVVRKPADTLSVPWDETDKDTLEDQVRMYLSRVVGRREGKGRATRDAMVGVVQRLDKDTTGLMVFARNTVAKHSLKEQLREHTVHRRYVAIVHGLLVTGRRFDTHLIQDRGDGLRGSWGVFRRPKEDHPPREAKQSITHVRPLLQLAGATSVECRLETGRQHQIRIHLSEAGHPLVGEAVYIRDYEAPRIDAPRPMLHAAELGFEHPRSGKQMRFRDDPPADFLAQLEALSRPPARKG